MTPDRKALNVNPGKKRPGEKIIPPNISAMAAIKPVFQGPNNMANTAIGKKPKLMRRNGVWMAKTCVRITVKAINTPLKTTVFVLEENKKTPPYVILIATLLHKRDVLYNVTAGCSGCTASF